MSDSLPQLEAQRSDLFRELAALGDFRRGSITATSGKCGKIACHCSKRDDPGHGPNFRLTRKIEGKTVTETLTLSRHCARLNGKWKRSIAFRSFVDKSSRSAKIFAPCDRSRIR